ncbi:hypothetical protein [Methylobacterium sp. J-068]|uniref:hypothetical protein n=1 Tax=Methylobacterium sp. J-068 TaxID=2836649 RepID=UPI001FB8FF86|nr:hypothetical protein [Methylobacterium sp. J-068]MCJ2033638.1 hypothetical protein [Methylobacterium sp. J-068]
MKRSKLEAYYRDQFGAPESDAVEPDDAPPVRRRRPEPRRRDARRGGFGVFRMLKLTLMLGPMALLLGATLLMDCNRSAQGSWVPEILRGTACARRDLAGRVFSLDSNLRTVANAIR